MPLRGFASRKKPKPTAPLDHLPPGYPACLAPQTDLIICKAVKKYPVQIQTQVVDLCKYVVTELRPHFRRATSEKLVRQDMALHEMNALLDYLLVENWDSDSRRYELKIEITRSNEWLRLVRDIANIPPAALTRPCESRDGTARKPKLWTETQRALAAVLVSQFDQLPENKKKQGKRQFVMKKAAEYVVKSKDGSKKPINPESLWRNYYEQTKCL